MPLLRLARTAALPGLLDRYEAQPLTYPEVGGTGDHPLPEGYHHVRRSTHLGRGSDVFDRAATALMTWQMHERSGLRVAARGPAEDGRTVVMGLGLGVHLVVPCRVVGVIDGETGSGRRRGFAYGTLPGHPESGEERFVVEQSGEDVWLAITAFSRPGNLLTRLGGPVGRLGQHVITARYERALAS